MTDPVNLESLYRKGAAKRAYDQVMKLYFDFLLPIYN
jgi:hypothetical protein